MPWNEPGKPRDPWRGGDQQPPDLDEVFASLKARLRRWFGGGRESGTQKRGGGGILPLVIIALVLWVLFNSVHIIDQAERGVVLTFGKYNRTLMPGLRLTMPPPFESITKVNVSEVRSFVDRGRMLTGNENLIEIGFAVQYRVIDPKDFLFNVRSPAEMLGEAAESAMREVVGTNDMDFILEAGRDQVGADTRALMQTILDRYSTGIEVSLFNLQEVKPPSQVQEAFDDVVKAREDQQRFVNEAEAYANKIIPEARGQAARVLQEAEGYRAAQVARATGATQRFELLLAAYRQAPEVTRQRMYIEAMEDVLQRTPKVLIDIEKGNPLIYLPLDEARSGYDGGLRMLPPADAASRGAESAGRTPPAADPRSRGREGGR